MAGSVASATVAHAVRPVVLVRAGRTVEDEHLPDAEGRTSAVTAYRPVVVGLDPAHSCEELLAFAFESAALHAAPLRVLYAWQLPFMPVAAEAKARRTLRETATRRLDRVLGPWREKYPAVELHPWPRRGARPCGCWTSRRTPVCWSSDAGSARPCSVPTPGRSRTRWCTTPAVRSPSCRTSDGERTPSGPSVRPSGP